MIASIKYFLRIFCLMSTFFSFSLFASDSFKVNFSQNHEMANRLKGVASSSLEKNIIELSSGPFLAAGQNQFKTFWTRDFCFSVRGLIQIGRGDVVRHHLETLLRFIREKDGLVPRVLDSSAPRWRVTWQAISRLFYLVDPSIPLTEPLNAEFEDEHHVEAIDSNIAILLASLEYAKSQPDGWSWWFSHLHEWIKIYHYYDNKKTESGLIHQPSFGDWQDSVDREGESFYTNLMYYIVSKKLSSISDFEIKEEDLQKTKERIIETFFDKKTGLFQSLAGYEYLSIDGNLLALDYHFFKKGSDEEKNLYQSLKQSVLWKDNPNHIPGFVTYPRYPLTWKTWAVLGVGLKGYHDYLYWSWLMALSGKVAFAQGDGEEGQKILDALDAMAQRDHFIGEIYFPKNDFPLWSSWLFASEIPFSWGAAFVIDFTNHIQ